MSKMNIYNKSFEEVEPTDEETAILDAFENGDPKYAPDISIEDLKKELGLESAFGIAHKYANPDLMSQEKKSFANAMTEKQPLSTHGGYFCAFYQGI
ncbi:hypothetical protein [Butyribacter sp.]|uniref:hypothetical protein n=1 Tax=Butyribacter sp. TaxID=2822465 RepID=UPI002A93EA1E|nr:hypothetical protein [Butyribacter sp.]